MQRRQKWAGCGHMGISRSREKPRNIIIRFVIYTQRRAESLYHISFKEIKQHVRLEGPFMEHLHYPVDLLHW